MTLLQVVPGLPVLWRQQVVTALFIVKKAIAIYRDSIGGLNNGWTHNWDDSSYAAAVLLAEDTGDASIRADVESWLNNWVDGGNGVTITDGGLRFISQWGSLRYAANTALLAGIYADNVSDPDGRYSALATETVDYILGDNPLGMSYVVGFGETFPQQPHHRGASGVDWSGFRNGQPNEYVLSGALVGGPKAADDFSYNDSRDDYISNEVAIDYNAGITGALARNAEEFRNVNTSPADGHGTMPLDPVVDPVVPVMPPHDGHDHGTMPMPTDPIVTDPVVSDPVVSDPVAPVMPPMDGHDGHDDMPMDDHDGHDHMAPPASSGEFIDITTWGTFHGSNNNSHDHELVGGRTAITTEAMDAYNNLRAFLGLSALTIDDVGEWAFAEQLTNNAQPYGEDIKSVGLYYAMQGAKVGWIAQDKYDPQILADIQRTARLGDPADVMTMVREFGISGYADYLEQYGIADTFISTLKMEPHYGGVMHGRTHGFLSIEGVAINHDINHLTVLSWDQSQPFMNDTFDWPQWPALDVSDSGVMEYYQSMVVLGDPVGLNMESVSAPVAPPVVPTDPVVTDPVVTDPVVTDPVVTDPVVTDPVVTDPVVTDPSASPIASHDKVLAAYFPEWGIYGRDYQLADVPADELTHLIYAFADLNAAGEMTLFDSYAATEKRFSAEESVTGEADQWYYPPEDPRSEQTIWGNFNQLALLKEANPHLTLSIAVGGWTLSDHFSTVTSTEAGRDTFSDSIVEFLTTYQVFDGIDFDWEYPGGGGEAGNSASPNDGANYALLMADVRAKLDDLGSELGRTYEISIASPGGLDKIANFNLAGLAPSVDFFNVMTYDFHGTWEDTTGHQAAFTGDPVGYDIETSVDAYLNAGVAPEQIVLGAPLYTRAWSGVADGGDGGYNEASSGAAPGTFEAGNYDYKDLLSQINAGAGWELYWDDNAQASYVYNAEQDIFSSFETTTSIALKAEWADGNGIGRHDVLGSIKRCHELT